jgi:hypothetical protein
MTPFGKPIKQLPIHILAGLQKNENNKTTIP